MWPRPWMSFSVVQSSTLFRQLSLILPWQEASAFIGQCGSQVFCGKNGTGSKESRQGVPRIGSSPIFATTYLAQIQAGGGVNGRKPYRNCALSSCEGVCLWIFLFCSPSQVNIHFARLIFVGLLPRCNWSPLVLYWAQRCHYNLPNLQVLLFP